MDGHHQEERVRARTRQGIPVLRTSLPGDIHAHFRIRLRYLHRGQHNLQHRRDKRGCGDFHERKRSEPRREPHIGIEGHALYRRRWKEHVGSRFRRAQGSFHFGSPGTGGGRRSNSLRDHSSQLLGGGERGELEIRPARCG